MPPWLHEVNAHNQLLVLLILVEASHVHFLLIWGSCSGTPLAAKGTKRFFPVLLLFPSRPQQVELFIVHRAHHELYLERSIWPLSSEVLPLNAEKCSATEQIQNIFSLIQYLLKLWISRGSRHHVSPCLLRWQEKSSLTLSAHPGARADDFAVYVTENGTAGLLGKCVFGIKIFPGYEAALLPGCSILILEGRVNRRRVLCNLVRVGDDSTEVFINLYEEKLATQRSPLFLSILVSAAKAVPAFNLIKPKFFTWCLVAHFKFVVVSVLCSEDRFVGCSLCFASAARHLSSVPHWSPHW